MAIFAGCRLLMKTLLLKDSPTILKDYKFMKNTDLRVKVLLKKCSTEIMEKLVLGKEFKIVLLFGAAYAAPN